MTRNILIAALATVCVVAFVPQAMAQSARSGCPAGTKALVGKSGKVTCQSNSSGRARLVAPATVKGGQSDGIAELQPLRDLSPNRKDGSK